jgi:trypsin
MMKFVCVLAVLAFQAAIAFQVTEDLDGFLDGANDEDLQQVVGQTRIVGGTAASRTRYPYFTRVDEYSRSHCGGVLIHYDIVLTAAHCASNYLSAVVNAYVTSGSYNDQINRSVQSVTVHPNYNSNTRVNDFAILKLSSPVYTVFPIALNGDGAAPGIGQSLTVIGVGAIRESGPSSGVLNEVSVNVLNPDTCNSQRQYNGAVVTSSMFCAGVPSGGRDSCQGDSGSPIIQVINGVDTLVGIVSWGEGCARANYPGVYARVTSARSWIDSTLCSANANSNTSPCGFANPISNPSSCGFADTVSNRRTPDTLPNSCNSPCGNVGYL